MCNIGKAALIDIKLGFFASNVIPLLSGWTGGVWLVAPDRAAVFDDKTARIGVVMPAFINDSICPNLKCNIKALDRAKAPIIPEKNREHIYRPYMWMHKRKHRRLSLLW